MMTTTPSCEGSVTITEGGRARSFDCGIEADDDDTLFNKKTRMIVIRSSIAVMLRKSISASFRLRRIARRSAALYLTTDAFGGAVVAALIGRLRNEPRGTALPHRRRGGRP
jgi:hypothetical protein